MRITEVSHYVECIPPVLKLFSVNPLMGNGKRPPLTSAVQSNRASQKHTFSLFSPFRCPEGTSVKTFQPGGCPTTGLCFHRWPSIGQAKPKLTFFKLQAVNKDLNLLLSLDN